MKRIELFKPIRSVEDYNKVITISTIGRQEIKDIMRIAYLVDGEQKNLRDIIFELSNGIDKLQELLEEKEKNFQLELNKVNSELEKQKEINALLYKEITKEGVI